MNFENIAKGQFLSLCRPCSKVQRTNPEKRLYGLLESPNVPLGIEQLHYNIYLVGRAGIGKSFFVSWLAGLELPFTYYATHGLQSTTIRCICQVHSSSERKLMFCIEVWESGASGKRQASDLLTECPSKTDAIIMLFSYTEKENLKFLPEIITECNKINSHRPCFIAVGIGWNPTELQCVRQKDIKEFAHQWKVPVIQLPVFHSEHEQSLSEEAYVNNYA